MAQTTNPDAPALPQEAVRRLLKYSFEPVSFDYTALTDAEKALVTPEEFEQLKAWVLSEPAKS